MSIPPRLRKLALLSTPLALCAAAACRMTQPAAPVLAQSDVVLAHTDKREAAELFSEFGGEKAFLQTVRYLYRWVLDENDFKRRDASLQGQLWLRRIQTITDANDNSRFLELVIPATGLSVNLKKADYRIPELKLDVRSGGYRVIRISRNAYTDSDARDFYRFDFSSDALNERLFQDRLNAVFPDAALFASMCDRLSRAIAELGLNTAGKAGGTVFFAPVEDVANEVWAFWEEGRMLFRFASDSDLANPAVWSQDLLDVTVYDTVRQTVVSHEEKPGDARFITRDQVGRALYNCIVIGRAIPLPAQKAEPAP